jgi:hypothetical protein
LSIQDLLKQLEDTANTIEQWLHQNETKINSPKTEHIPDATLLKRFRQTERFAHKLAYDTTLETKDKKSMSINGKKVSVNINPILVKDDDGVKREYIVRQIKANHSGLVSFVLFSKDTANPRVHVLFRGTHNTGSAKRDLETLGFGPGSTSFYANKQEIIKSVRQVVAYKQSHSDIPVDLTVAGHSLGGADVKNFTASFLEDIVKAPHAHPSPFAKVKTLNIMHVNAAGVTDKTAKNCDRYLHSIRERKIPLQINQYIIHAGGDAVQQTGYTSIFADATKKQTDTYLLYADIGNNSKLMDAALFLTGRITPLKIVGRSYAAHTAFVFGKNKHVDTQFRIYSNKTPGEDVFIERHLKNKFHAKMQEKYPLFALMHYCVQAAHFVYATGAKFFRRP